MSGGKLSSQAFDQLLLQYLTGQDNNYTLLHYLQICQLPDHYQLHDEPDELQTEMEFKEFRYPNKRKWAQVVEKNNITKIYICCSEDPLERIRYPDAVEIESFIVLKGTERVKKLERFKYLISQLFSVIDIKGVSRGSYVDEERTRNAVRAILKKR